MSEWIKKLRVFSLILLIPFMFGCLEEEMTEEEGNPSNNAPIEDPGDSTPSPPATVEQGDYRFIFVSSTKVNGSGATTGIGSGLADMDSVCESDADDLGLQGDFKAFIADGANRIPGGSDWVLVTGKEYRNLGKQVISVALDGNGSAGGDLTVLTDPGGTWDLTSSIHDQAEFVWTGMQGNGSEATDNCTGWTSTSGHGEYGKSNLSAGEIWDLGYSSGWSFYSNATDDSGAITTSCSETKSIYCAQTLQPPPAGDWKRVFLSAGETAMNVGLSGIDAFCASEASSKGFSGTYKALVGTNTRTACTTAGCSGATGIEQSSDWVLQANMNYRQEDGYTHIGTTNAHAIFDFGDGSTSAIEYGFSGTSDTYVTGFSNQWTSGTTSYNRCLDFTVNSGAAAQPIIGRGNAQEGKAVQDSFSTPKFCSQTTKIVCVEQ